MFGLSPVQVLIFMTIAAVLFGAKRLPEVGRGLGSGLREFKGGITGAAEPTPRPDPLEVGAGRAQGADDTTG